MNQPSDDLTSAMPCARPIHCLSTLLAPMLLTMFAGCATYAPKPLEAADPAATTASPDAPDLAALRVAAASLKHPLLKPVEIGSGGAITPQAAAALAVVANPNLRALRDRRGVAQAQLLSAGILPNPQFSANLDHPAFGNTDGATSAFGVGLNWEVTALIVRNANIATARAGAESVDLDIAWQEWQVALGAKLHAARVLWLSKEVDAEADAETQAAARTESLQRGIEAGLATLTDRDAAAAATEKRHAAFVAARSALRVEEHMLRQAIGLRPEAVVTVIEDPASSAAVPDLSPQELSARIQAGRLDLMALRAGYQSQEQKLRAAVLSQFPKVGIGITRARDTSDVGTIGLGITLDLPIFDRAQGRIAVETATRQQLFDEFTARTFDARADAARAIQELGGLDEQIQAADAVLARLTTLESGASAAVRTGLADTLTLYQIRNDLADARADLLHLRRRQDELRIAVEAASGSSL